MTNPIVDTLREQIRSLEVSISEAERATQNAGTTLAQAIAAADKARDEAIAAARKTRAKAVAAARDASPSTDLTRLRREHKILTETVARLDPASTKHPCPECQADGVTYTAKTAAGLGAHRHRLHGVQGTSLTAGYIAARAAKETPPIVPSPAPSPAPVSARDPELDRLLDEEEQIARRSEEVRRARGASLPRPPARDPNPMTVDEALGVLEGATAV